MNSALCLAPNFEVIPNPTENSVRQYSFLKQSQTTEKSNPHSLSRRLLHFFGTIDGLEQQEIELPAFAESFYMSTMQGSSIRSFVAGSSMWAVYGAGVTIAVPIPEIGGGIEFMNAKELTDFRKLHPEIGSFLE